MIDQTFDCSGSALVAWNGSYEAAQALRLALPLLHHAPDVQLVTISEAPVETDAEQAIAYLARHGVSARARERAAGKGGVAEALIECAAEMDAAYVVMGAYGHSRVRETILGGVTRDLLHASPLPLLMAH